MSYRVQELEEIGPYYGRKLELCGIVTTTDLLKVCSRDQARNAMAAASGVSEPLLLKWTNLVDLMRIKGIGRRYSDLLGAAGIGSVKQLRRWNVENLAVAMRQTNARQRRSRTLPSSAQIRSWIERAKDLRPVIAH
ncbi:DUF4332 domain-containing protein [Pelagibius litoralis]|uniref:DUF4332 domain-containing protein n=1 Tax=Pelagibius litoralis TaxID=374515 RepID=A0A967F1K4_9PROT|nr:DUF4332 domain-containing protein [Pelagibius litoralis]NIA71390.1 DUF4332 domain-containing protein [Pelagibius litoralis]